MKKVLSIFLSIIQLFIAILLLVSCKKEDKAVYRAELEIMTDFGLEHGVETAKLTQENTTYERTVIFPFNYSICEQKLLIKRYTADGKCRTIRETFVSPNINAINEDVNYEYYIYDDNGEKLEGNYGTRFDLGRASFHAWSESYGALAKKAGKHVITYKVPALSGEDSTWGKWSTESIEYQMIVDAKEDTRNKEVVIRLTNNDYTKYSKEQLSLNMDLYVLKERPQFTAFDAISGEFVDGELIWRARQLRLNAAKEYRFYLPKTINECMGVWWCEVNYGYSESYRSNTYYCLVMFVGEEEPLPNIETEQELVNQQTAYYEYTPDLTANYLIHIDNLEDWEIEVFNAQGEQCRISRFNDVSVLLKEGETYKISVKNMGNTAVSKLSITRGVCILQDEWEEYIIEHRTAGYSYYMIFVNTEGIYEVPTHFEVNGLIVQNGYKYEWYDKDLNLISSGKRAYLKTGAGTYYFLKIDTHSAIDQMIEITIKLICSID